MENKMREIKLEKVTLNIGTGEPGPRLDNAMKLLNMISGKKPIQTTTQKRIPTWTIRPGLAIGCKVTLRKEVAIKVLKGLLEANNNELKDSVFGEGTFCFGVKEYIEIPGAEYDPDIGIIGLEAAVTLERPGFRIKRRKLRKKKVPNKVRITRQETIDFMKNNFKVEVIAE